MKHGMIFGLRATVLIIAMMTLMLSVTALPIMAKQAADMNPEYAHLQYPILIGIYVTVVPFLIACIQSLKLLSYIKHHQAFSEMAVHALNRIKQCAIAIMALYIAGMIVLIFESALHPGIAIIGMGIVFACVTILLFASVLNELLKNVIKLKLENDLTI